VSDAKFQVSALERHIGCDIACMYVWLVTKRRPREFNLGTELILLSASALDEFVEAASAIKSKKNVRLECVWALWKIQQKKKKEIGTHRIRRFRRYLQKGKRTSGRRYNPVSRQQMCQNIQLLMGTTQSACRKACRNLGGKWEMGQESE
jgi:hypothetical protein